MEAKKRQEKISRTGSSNVAICKNVLWKTFTLWVAFYISFYLFHFLHFSSCYCLSSFLSFFPILSSFFFLLSFFLPFFIHSLIPFISFPSFLFSVPFLPSFLLSFHSSPSFLPSLLSPFPSVLPFFFFPFSFLFLPIIFSPFLSFPFYNFRLFRSLCFILSA